MALVCTPLIFVNVVFRTNNKDSAAPVQKLLNAPVQISSLRTETEEIKQSNSIWLSKRDSNTVSFLILHLFLIPMFQDNYLALRKFLLFLVEYLLVFALSVNLVCEFLQIVDQKKLEKAEAQIKKKQDRKQDNKSKPT